MFTVMELALLTDNEQETKELGKMLSKLLPPNSVVLLKGDLGSGKTTLVKGVAEGLGIKEPVLSPTFNILKCYFESNPPLYHIDAYRLENTNLEMGLEEYIDGDGLCFIEWPDRINELLPRQHLDIFLFRKDENTRSILLQSNAPKYDEVIKKLTEQIDG